MSVETKKPLSNGLITLMAVAIGVIVANLYYQQPLLHQISHDFHVGTARASLLMTLSQVGYAIGLAFVVPLGDVWPRRRLVVGIFVLAAVTMAVSASLTSFTILAVVTLVIGLSSVGGQVLIPLAADLAEPEQRGRVIARVMTGLLLGVLLSRTVSGLIAQLSSWRVVYWSAAGLLAIMAVVLHRVLPKEAAREHVAYRKLVGGVFSLFVTQRQLRRRAYLGAVIFASNNALWTTLSFLLAGAPFHYSNAVIGLFGLFGVAGVLAANAAGHQADRQRTRASTVIFATLMLLAFVILALGRNTVILLALGIIVLDTGMQGMQITNQSLIYGLLPGGRSRLNSAYMVSAFVGASIGSYLAGQLYAHFGWYGDCWLGGGLGVALLVPALLWRSPKSETSSISGVAVER
ncbi:MAG TPA: MFS transporter [Acidimicrobiales bacterium]|jgi:predicted MFS family arabinose efflux permease|nr:MFS transporter [Acidimicrobiales bacterium]